MAEIGWHFMHAHWRWARLSRTNLATYQQSRVRQIIAYAQQHSPFYRDYWRGYDLNAWQTLPMIDKRVMMEHFSAFNTRGITLEQAMQVALQAEQQRDFTPTINGLTVGLSSGTSGHRGLFLVSPAEQHAWAGTIMARTLHRWHRQACKVAFFLRSNSNLYAQVGGRLVQLRYFDLMQPLEQAIPVLNRFQPDLLIGPPSLLALLAREQGQHLRIQPERLIAVAEVLEPQDRTAFMQTFGAPVHQIYQCTEGLLAASCSHGALHIQEDLVAIQCEALAGDPKRVMPIITDLWRTTQPIVRYRLNDILTLSDEPCPCGSDFRVIASIEGRCDDMFNFPMRTGGMRSVFPDLIRRMILLSSADILDYQATQDQAGQLHIHLATPADADWPALTHALQQTVERILAQYDCYVNAFSITSGLVALPPGAKRRRVWRRYEKQ